MSPNSLQNPDIEASSAIPITKDLWIKPTNILFRLRHNYLPDQHNFFRSKNHGNILLDFMRMDKETITTILKPAKYNS